MSLVTGDMVSGIGGVQGENLRNGMVWKLGGCCFCYWYEIQIAVLYFKFNLAQRSC